jgi:hypothetical protein
MPPEYLAILMHLSTPLILTDGEVTNIKLLIASGFPLLYL